MEKTDIRIKNMPPNHSIFKFMPRRAACLFALSAIIFALSFSAVIADSYEYPDIFVKDGRLNAVIVVGNKAPASDAIAQSNLVQYFTGLGISAAGSAKLSSEISSLSQNMVLIGSACNNPISAQALGNPEPCNDGILPGKPLIKLLKADGYFHLVVAGYTEKETRDVVNSLAGYDKLEASENAEVMQEHAILAKTNATNVTNYAEGENNRIIDELNRKLANMTGQDKKEKSQSQATEETSAVQNETATVPASQEEKSKHKSMIIRFVNWIKSIFG